MLNDEEKIKALEYIIADAERRVGQFVLSEEKYNDNYIKKNREIILKAYDDISKI